jgi:prepilin-type N-terminal cleavage/methylation domain-containing protein
MKRNKDEQGVTLLELLIAMSIMGFLSMAIFSTLTGGIRVYERVQTYAMVQTETLLSLELMEKDIRNAFNISSIPFLGQSQSVSFAGRYAKVDEEGNPYMSLGQIRYYFDTDQRALLRTEKNYAQAVADEPLGERAVRRMAGVQNVSFTYFDKDEETEEYAWQNFWRSEEGRPLGVRIMVTYQDGGRHVTLVRQIHASPQG